MPLFERNSKWFVAATVTGHSLGLTINARDWVFVGEVESPRVNAAPFAAATLSIDQDINHNDNSNDDNDTDCKTTKESMSVNRQSDSTFRFMLACNLPQIPRQIHFFFRVFFAVVTATVISSLPLSIFSTASSAFCSTCRT